MLGVFRKAWADARSYGAAWAAHGLSYRILNRLAGYQVLNGVKAIFGTYGGALSDRFGRVKLLCAGWVLYAIMYATIGQLRSVPLVFAAVAVYGLYGALTEGADRALVADLVPAAVRGRAFGLFNAVNGLGLLAAGLLFGELWDRFGSGTAFTVAAAQALVAAALLPAMRLRAEPRPVS